MTAPEVSPSDVHAAVEGVVDEFRGEFPPDAVVILARPKWSGPAVLSVDGIDFGVVACSSVLAVHAALSEAAGPVVLLSEADKTELGVQVCGRIAGGRPRATDRRDTLKRLFGTTQLDPRLLQERWLTDELLAGAPAGGYPPVVGGVLTLEHALRTLTIEQFGLTDLSPSPGAFLDWVNQAETRSRILNAPSQIRDRVFGDVLPGAVPFAQELLAALSGPESHDLITLGLVAGAIAPATGSQAAAAEALFRAKIGGRKLGPVAGVSWGHAAEQVLASRLQTDIEIESVLMAADELLESLEAVDLAIGNNYLRSSFRRRLSSHGHALVAALQNSDTIGELLATQTAVQTHRLSSVEQRRSERVQMSTRLAQWLNDGVEGDRSALGSAGSWYREEGAWVDYARRTLTEPESEPDLAFAYDKLRAAVTAKRSAQNREFATVISGWDQGTSPSVLLIEHALDEVVAPVATAQPVLVLVMDGMSWDVWHQLRSDLSRRGWTRAIDTAHQMDRACFAAFPTVTEHSRSSLLAGRLLSGGDQNDEKKAFATHPGLVALSQKSKPPTAFHKGELSRADGGGLDAKLADLIADPNQRVIACVVNAVDDHLLKGDQVKPDWSIDVISPLDLLIDRAQYAGRAVVVTADHGHVLDVDSEARVIAGAKERWRPDEGDLADDEVRVSGPRTLAGDGTVVMPWNEQLRYSSGRRNGYHGGATPQEILVPLDVLFSGSSPDGFESADHRPPRWWSFGVARSEEVVVTGSTPVMGSTKTDPPTLFPPEVGSPTASWLESLLRSQRMEDQRRLAGSRVPDEARVRDVLLALIGNRDRLTHLELAEATGLAVGRIRGLVASITRLLNVDGYAVVDDDGDTVALDQDLARTQFGLN